MYRTEIRTVNEKTTIIEYLQLKFEDVNKTIKQKTKDILEDVNKCDFKRLEELTKDIRMLEQERGYLTKEIVNIFPVTTVVAMYSEMDLYKQELKYSFKEYDLLSAYEHRTRPITLIERELLVEKISYRLKSAKV